MSAVKVYKASAGSGKTFTLAVQYIRLLITSDPSEYLHTLAVTFTNKATTEMKDRILEQLYGIAHSLPKSDDYLNALHEDLKKSGKDMKDEQIREKCRQALHLILHDYSRFRIETIDSFFQAVLRNLAHELGLNAKLQIDLNDKQILSQAVDNMVDGIGKEQAPEMSGSKDMQEEATNTQPVTGSAPTAEEKAGVVSWIDNYVKEQIENADNWDVRSKIKDLASIIFKEEYMRREESFRDRINNEALLKEYRDKLYAIRNVQKQTLDEAVASLQKAINDFPHEVESVVSRGSWITNYLNKMKQGNYQDAEPTENQQNSLEDPKLMVKKKDQSNTALLSDLAPLAAAIKQTEQTRRECIRTINTIDLSIQHINPLRLLSQVEREVTSITNDSNRFILAKTPILLYRLIEGCDAPFVFEKMGTLFHNVMIDEFQDTSKLQWENFKVLLLESQSVGGSNLLVGDIKQSIYRFRNGDWHILKNIDNELKYSKTKIETLDKNFRSDVNIIAFNNAFFQIAAQLLDGQHDDESEESHLISEIYADVAQEWPAGKTPAGHVQIMLKKGKVEDWEEMMLEDLCQQIEQLHDGGLPYNQMCVLLRSRTNVRKLIDYVQSHLDVKMISDEGFKLYSSKTLNTLIAALRVVCYGKQDAISERFLVKEYLTMTNGENVSIEQYATAPLGEALPEEFTQRMFELKEYPLHELCEELYRILQLQRIQGEDAYVMTFYDELRAYLRNGTSDIQSFLEYWETDMKNKDIPACQVDGINIVTIHKSKGLQYHTVLMPFCNDDMESIRSSEMLWCDANDAPYDMLGSLPINGARGKFENSSYCNDYENERLQRRIEELNALYVAFTRAEHNLYVWGASSESTLNYATLIKGTIENGLTSGIADKTDACIEESNKGDDPILTWSLGTPVTSTKKKQATAQPDENRLSPHFDEQNVEFRSFNRRMDFRQSNEAEQFIRQQGDEMTAMLSDTTDGSAPFLPPTPSFIEQGKLLHEIFSHIETADQLGKVLQTYMNKGVLKNQSELQNTQRLIEKALSQPQAAKWFDGSYKVQNECEILHIDTTTGEQVNHRPDRVMISDNEVIVVDFKFGRPKPDQYIPQVQGYMNLLAEMHPDKQVTGYLWYVYQGKIEEVKA